MKPEIDCLKRYSERIKKRSNVFGIVICLSIFTSSKCPVAMVSSHYGIQNAKQYFARIF
jgi:hypothetical protein